MNGFIAGKEQLLPDLQAGDMCKDSKNICK
jgi:hypothetical protein